ncbi:hypothetical protein JCM10449v2_007659 [Rhodotorula kratochvilovae]
MADKPPSRYAHPSGPSSSAATPGTEDTRAVSSGQRDISSSSSTAKSSTSTVNAQPAVVAAKPTLSKDKPSRPPVPPASQIDSSFDAQQDGETDSSQSSLAASKPTPTLKKARKPKPKPKVKLRQRKLSHFIKINADHVASGTSSSSPRDASSVGPSGSSSKDSQPAAAAESRSAGTSLPSAPSPSLDPPVRTAAPATAAPVATAESNAAFALAQTSPRADDRAHQVSAPAASAPAAPPPIAGFSLPPFDSTPGGVTEGLGNCGTIADAYDEVDGRDGDIVEDVARRWATDRAWVRRGQLAVIAGVVGAPLMLLRVIDGTLYPRGADLQHAPGTASGVLYDGSVHYSSYSDEYNDWAPYLRAEHIFIPNSVLLAQPDVGLFFGAGDEQPWLPAGGAATSGVKGAVRATEFIEDGAKARPQKGKGVRTGKKADRALAATEDTGRQKGKGKTVEAEKVEKEKPSAAVPDPVFSHVDLKNWRDNEALMKEIEQAKTHEARLAILDRILATLPQKWEPQLPSAAKNYGEIADQPLLADVETANMQEFLDKLPDKSLFAHLTDVEARALLRQQHHAPIAALAHLNSAEWTAAWSQDGLALLFDPAFRPAVVSYLDSRVDCLPRSEVDVLLHLALGRLPPRASLMATPIVQRTYTSRPTLFFLAELVQSCELYKLPREEIGYAVDNLRNAQPPKSREPPTLAISTGTSARAPYVPASTKPASLTPPLPAANPASLTLLPPGSAAPATLAGLPLGMPSPAPAAIPFTLSRRATHALAHTVTNIASRSTGERPQWFYLFAVSPVDDEWEQQSVTLLLYAHPPSFPYTARLMDLFNVGFEQVFIRALAPHTLTSPLERLGLEIPSLAQIWREHQAASVLYGRLTWRGYM